jgi:glycosyltransferase involved in cell wall biosynthesis
MKLAYICPWFSTEYKGPLYNLLNELSRHIKVVCITSRQKYVQYFNRKEKYRQKIEFINKNFKIHRFESIAPRDIIIPFNIEKILEEENPDIIQSDEFFRFTSLKAWNFAKKKGIPFILNSRMRERPGILRNLFYKLMSFIAKDMVNGCDKIVAIGEEAKKEFLKWFPNSREKIVVIPTGIDPNKFKNIGRKQAVNFRKKYSIPLNKKIILDVARVYPVKRIDLLIEVFNLVKKKCPDTVLVIVGPAEEKEMLKIKNLISKLGLRIGKDVFFTGSIPNEQIGPAYVAADVFANTSETEGICFSFLEAMCFKLPIVAFNVGGNRDTIFNGKNGYLINFGDVERFADKLVKILSKRKVKVKLGKIAYKAVQTKFNIRGILKKLVNLFKESLKFKNDHLQI